jgi:pimeloyl-ACP methyl ester carboxylesterase
MTVTENLESAPAWFTLAIAQAAEVREIRVDGTSISYRAWGQPGPDGGGLVLIHGGAAHAHWWDHLAPMLAVNRPVVALDLSGHGESGRRDVYSLSTWAAEAMAVGRDAFHGPPTIIGHSMGGMVSLAAAPRYGDQLAGVVAIDSPIRDLAPEELAAREHRAFGPRRIYPTRAAVLARFRVVPDQVTLPYIFDHVAQTSVREVEGGWSWKFDPAVFVRTPIKPQSLGRLDCRAAIFRAESGIVPPAMGEMIFDRLGRVAPVIEIPFSEHHVMLDQPIALVTGLRTLLADWEHSIARA